MCVFWAAGAGLEPLPVSAVSAGLVPARGGAATLTGADIAADALAEERVAHAAQGFFARTPQPR